MKYMIKAITGHRKMKLSWMVCHCTLCAVLIASCSMMKEDRSDCPDDSNPLRVTLRYDYNIQRANMFHDHVEKATVYVVDPATGTVVDTQTAQNVTQHTQGEDATQWQPLRSTAFGFNFENLDAGQYRLYATGCSAADAAYETVAPGIGETISRLEFSVPTDAEDHVRAERLDTVWNTLKPVDIIVPYDGATEATIPLMRLTNDLNIIVFRRDGSLDNGHERYDVRVISQHPTLDYNSQPTADRTVVYRPFAAWTTETTVDGEAASPRLSAGRDGTHNPAAPPSLSAAASPPRTS